MGILKVHRGKIVNPPGWNSLIEFPPENCKLHLSRLNLLEAGITAPIQGLTNMNTMLAKEKPDLLFNNPLKQKVYVFLKNNPGKDFEAFQVLTGDSAVSRQHFNEVEQAIRAREERDRVRAVPRDVNALFLQGA